MIILSMVRSLDLGRCHEASELVVADMTKAESDAMFRAAVNSVPVHLVSDKAVKLREVVDLGKVTVRNFDRLVNGDLAHLGDALIAGKRVVFTDGLLLVTAAAAFVGAVEILAK